MRLKPNDSHLYTGKSFIFCLTAWFLLSSILYIAVYFLEDSRKSDLVKIGVAISKDISSQSGLPLLERKIDHLFRLIENITQKPEVVFASIIDHKNKLIAYTDQDQFFTFARENSEELEGVHYWSISNQSNHKVMNFSSDITFSDTRVGEVFISLATKNMGIFKRSFLFLSLVSLVGLLGLFGIVRHRDILGWWHTKRIRFPASHSGPLSPAPGRAPKRAEKDPHDFFCPLCHSPGHFSRSSCRMEGLDNFLLIKSYSKKNRDVMLGDLTRFKELSWLEKRIIAQCGKIITTISIEKS